MKIAPKPEDEEERIASLESYEVLDTLPEQAYDDLTKLAAEICQTPISLVSLVDSTRQWFKSAVGIDAKETPRDWAFCSHAILGQKLFEVPNAMEDDRFHDNPLVADAPDIRFYAGAPLIDDEGRGLGTLCVIDRVPRELTQQQREMLLALGRRVVSELELRRRILRQTQVAKEREQLLSRLSAANRELKDFAYVVSHDLKAPLRAISSLSSWLESDYKDKIDEEGQKQLSYLVNRSNRMGKLIDGILAYSRAGRVEGDSRDIELTALVSDVIESIAPSQDIKVSIETALPRIKADPVRITQLFQNLISNAVQHLNRMDGEVRISARKEDGHWRFSVKDNGPGIDPKYFDRIFKLFQTLQPRDDKESTGIGLALVKRIVEAHAGEVSVVSAPGEGATFTFTLPIDYER
ncbi:MAG: sensor histidine kinase [Limisphaerales bacterium]